MGRRIVPGLPCQPRQLFFRQTLEPFQSGEPRQLRQGQSRRRAAGGRAAVEGILLPDDQTLPIGGRAVKSAPASSQNSAAIRSARPTASRRQEVEKSVSYSSSSAQQ